MRKTHIKELVCNTMSEINFNKNKIHIEVFTHVGADS